ncbi:hypothetical protein AD933_01315 [Acetobacter malorum]|uniref:Uncharacterized protein n=1 Tax=Acetobacter malorum TaxID=178901 RepID=A0A149S007_9PROT|nr:hypothetical protein [Acetobacter malorum]KXV20026.1 hypothetical protein AD933_01315 [Acetobacter malorum]
MITKMDIIKFIYKERTLICSLSIGFFFSIKILMKNWILSYDKIIINFTIIIISDFLLPFSCFLWVATGSFFEKMGFLDLIGILIGVLGASNCIVYFFALKYIKKPFVYSYKDLENDKKRYQNFFDGVYIFSALVIAIIAAYEKIKKYDDINTLTYLSVISAFVFVPRVCKFLLEINKFKMIKSLLRD